MRPFHTRSASSATGSELEPIIRTSSDWFGFSALFNETLLLVKFSLYLLFFFASYNIISFITVKRSGTTPLSYKKIFILIRSEIVSFIKGLVGSIFDLDVINAPPITFYQSIVNYIMSYHDPGCTRLESIIIYSVKYVFCTGYILGYMVLTVLTYPILWVNEKLGLTSIKYYTQYFYAPHINDLNLTKNGAIGLIYGGWAILIGCYLVNGKYNYKHLVSLYQSNYKNLVSIYESKSKNLRSNIMHALKNALKDFEPEPGPDQELLYNVFNRRKQEYTPSGEKIETPTPHQGTLIPSTTDQFIVMNKKVAPTKMSKLRVPPVLGTILGLPAKRLTPNPTSSLNKDGLERDCASTPPGDPTKPPLEYVSLKELETMVVVKTAVETRSSLLLQSPAFPGSANVRRLILYAPHLDLRIPSSNSEFRIIHQDRLNPTKFDGIARCPTPIDVETYQSETTKYAVSNNEPVPQGFIIEHLPTRFVSYNSKNPQTKPKSNYSRTQFYKESNNIRYTAYGLLTYSSLCKYLGATDLTLGSTKFNINYYWSFLEESLLNIPAGTSGSVITPELTDQVKLITLAYAIVQWWCYITLYEFSLSGSNYMIFNPQGSLSGLFQSNLVGDLLASMSITVLIGGTSLGILLYYCTHWFARYPGQNYGVQTLRNLTIVGYLALRIECFRNPDLLDPSLSNIGSVTKWSSYSSPARALYTLGVIWVLSNLVLDGQLTKSILDTLDEGDLKTFITLITNVQFNRGSGIMSLPKGPAIELYSKSIGGISALVWFNELINYIPWSKVRSLHACTIGVMALVVLLNDLLYTWCAWLPNRAFDEVGILDKLIPMCSGRSCTTLFAARRALTQESDAITYFKKLVETPGYPQTSIEQSVCVPLAMLWVIAHTAIKLNLKYVTKTNTHTRITKTFQLDRLLNQYKYTDQLLLHHLGPSTEGTLRDTNYAWFSLQLYDAFMRDLTNILEVDNAAHSATEFTLTIPEVSTPKSAQEQTNIVTNPLINYYTSLAKSFPRLTHTPLIKYRTYNLCPSTPVLSEKNIIFTNARTKQTITEDVLLQGVNEGARFHLAWVQTCARAKVHSFNIDTKDTGVQLHSPLTGSGTLMQGSTFKPTINAITETAVQFNKSRNAARIMTADVNNRLYKQIDYTITSTPKRELLDLVPACVISLVMSCALTTITPLLGSHSVVQLFINSLGLCMGSVITSTTVGVHTILRLLPQIVYNLGSLTEMLAQWMPILGDLTSWMPIITPGDMSFTPTPDSIYKIGVTAITSFRLLHYLGTNIIVRGALNQVTQTRPFIIMGKLSSLIYRHINAISYMVLAIISFRVILYLRNMFKTVRNLRDLINMFKTLSTHSLRDLVIHLFRTRYPALFRSIKIG